MSKLHLRANIPGSRGTGSASAFDADLDQLRARSASRTRHFGNVHAARSDELGLGLRVAIESAQQRDEVVVGHGSLVAAENARDVAAREAGFADDVGLFQIVPLSEAVQGGAEVAHLRGMLRVECRVLSVYARSTLAYKNEHRISLPTASQFMGCSVFCNIHSIRVLRGRFSLRTLRDKGRGTDADHGRRELHGLRELI